MEDRSVQVSTDNGTTWSYAGQSIDDWTKADTGTTDNTALSLAFAADASGNVYAEGPDGNVYRLGK